MKTYIMTDLEGVSGVCSAEYMNTATPFYQDARRYLMADLNAAIAGAFDGGATEVVVYDGHSDGNNFIPDLLDARAASGAVGGQWYERLDEGFHAAFFVGCHAMAGTADAFLDHTQSAARIFDYRVNGRSMGEIGQWGLICGAFGIPVVLVTGDEAACVETEQFFPGCRTVAVKRACGRNRAACYPVAEVRDRIRAAAAEALRDPRPIEPFSVEPPIVCEQTYTRTDMADDAEHYRGYERVDGRTCRKLAHAATDVVM